MPQTRIVKWDASAHRATAFCADDNSKVEIGPAQWDDTNDQAEIHPGGGDYQVKWNAAAQRMEARNVSDKCCCPDHIWEMASYGGGYLMAYFEGFENCGSANCASLLNGNAFICTHGSWGGHTNNIYYEAGHVKIDIRNTGITNPSDSYRGVVYQLTDDVPPLHYCACWYQAVDMYYMNTPYANNLTTCRPEGRSGRYGTLTLMCCD
jgi:hypothetical protein